jgi:branched-chain amino acid transport system ATP-binding protein
MTSPVPDPTPLPAAHLAVRGLTAAYGGFVALTGIDLDVAPGGCVCVVGPNGAGKTTLLSNIAGLFRPRAGSIALAGREIGGLGAEEIARLGVAMVPEGRRIFGTMTVEENLRLGATVRRRDGGVAADIERVLDTFPILRERFRGQAGKLSGGEQQMLAIARALMAKPKLMMIDEPSLGLAPIVVDKVYEVLADLRRGGLTLVIVEQNTARIADIADRIHVLRGGRLVLSLDPGQLDDAALLDEAYFGYGAEAEAEAVG